MANRLPAFSEQCRLPGNAAEDTGLSAPPRCKRGPAEAGHFWPSVGQPGVRVGGCGEKREWYTHMCTHSTSWPFWVPPYGLSCGWSHRDHLLCPPPSHPRPRSTHTYPGYPFVCHGSHSQRGPTVPSSSRSRRTLSPTL